MIGNEEIEEITQETEVIGPDESEKPSYESMYYMYIRCFSK